MPMPSPSYDWLAPLDAILNATAAVLLLAGYIAIRAKYVRVHRACMISAFTVSVAFFISYCIADQLPRGRRAFRRPRSVRPVYFTILSTHIVLAVVIVPLALVTLGRALRGRFARHRRIARWTWPIWMYVSVTGVVVYLMVYKLYPHLPPARLVARMPRTAAVARKARRTRMRFTRRCIGARPGPPERSSYPLRPGREGIRDDVEEEQRRRSSSGASALTQNHILEIRALAVDALGRRRDPSCDFARLVHRLHQLGIARAVFFGRQPFAAVRRELLGRKQVSVRVAALPRISFSCD